MLRMLLVEDNRIYRETFKESLRKHFPPLLIDEAEDGNKVLEENNEFKPHLIFRLPDTNGLHLTQKIKKDFPNIRIAILTNYDLPEYQQVSVQCGAEGFFVKELLKWDEIETPC